MTVHPHAPLEPQLEAAAAAIAAAGVVGFPTETFYGLAADPRLEQAVARLFELKGRAESQPIGLIAADLAQVERIADLPARALRLARAFWPGPLTLVVPARVPLAGAVRSGRGLVGVRVSSHPVARALAAAFGHPITATSANRSGEPPAVTAEAVARVLPDLPLLVDGGPATGGAPSTVVEVAGGEIALLRAGAVPWERVLESLDD
ncbi:MAG TPA: L-threonylcarbamoyladenylate synthase [Vicinamibacterales bacterium]